MALEENVSETVDKNQRSYDLEERTLVFTKRVIRFVGKLKKNVANIEIGRQLVRSAGSVGANYIEANEALSGKDFVMRTKICRKEAKETCYWLKLITCSNDQEAERQGLLAEATEIMKIFGSIVTKSQNKPQRQ
jgi:four helix bundle protein